MEVHEKWCRGRKKRDETAEGKMDEENWRTEPVCGLGERERESLRDRIIK